MGSTLALIALGSNLGDRRAILDRAIAELSGSSEVVVQKVSRYNETPPVGGPGGQGSFLNAAAALRTTLDPFALHRLLIEVEQQAGRVREVRWDARTLDLDLILFGDQIIDTPELVVPHSRFAVRRFVVSPLAEVAPEAIDPITGRSVAELLLNLDRRPSFVAFDRGTDANLTETSAYALSRSLPGSTVTSSLAPPLAGDVRAPIDRMLGGLRNAIGCLACESIWHRSEGGDGWLISPFHPRGEFEGLRSWLSSVPTERADGSAPRGVQLEGRLAAIEEILEGVPRPTFIVELGRDRPIERRAVCEPTIPRLRAEAVGHQEIADEIRAACEASHAGYGTP